MLKKTNLLQRKYLTQLLKYTAFYGILSIGIFTLSSCDPEPDELIGSWKLQVLTTSECPNSNENFDFSFDSSGCADFQGSQLCIDGIIEFKEDGTWANSGDVTLGGDVISDLTSNGTWSRTGVSVVMCDSDGDCNGSTVVLVGDMVTVNDNTSGCKRRREFQRI